MAAALRLGACDYSAEPSENASRAPVSQLAVERRSPICHFIVVREDLPRGIQSAMLVHAAGESSPGGLDAGTYAIVKAVPDEKALATVAADLHGVGVEFVSIFEPDLPYNGALMALGLIPKRKEELRRYLRKLPLLK